MSSKGSVVNLFGRAFSTLHIVTTVVPEMQNVFRGYPTAADALERASVEGHTPTPASDGGL
eukprot:365377-Chlamydomonas_euryale.AAC.9